MKTPKTLRIEHINEVDRNLAAVWTVVVVEAISDSVITFPEGTRALTCVR